MSAGLRLRVDGVAPNRHGALRYAGGLNLINVALGIYLRRDDPDRPALTPPADCELSEFHMKSETRPCENVKPYGKLPALRSRSAHNSANRTRTRYSRGLGILTVISPKLVLGQGLTHYDGCVRQCTDALRRRRSTATEATAVGRLIARPPAFDRSQIHAVICFKPGGQGDHPLGRSRRACHKYPRCVRVISGQVNRCARESV